MTQYGCIENNKLTCLREGKPEVIQPTQSWEVIAIGEEYKVRRRLEYPTIGDQLDVIWKFLDMNKLTLVFSQEVTDMSNAVKAVKTTYPKP